MAATDCIDILILSNGPGELTTWVRPVVKALHQQNLAGFSAGTASKPRLRLSLVLAPCPNASGQEVAIAQSYPEIERVQAAEHFFPFLLWGKTAANWSWSKRGIVIFLGGEQFFTVIIGKRLGYRTLVYGEWETRWHRWIDRFAVMKPELIKQAPAAYAHKFTVVGDLMADVQSSSTPSLLQSAAPLIGLLPGSKPAKLAQGVPLALAVAEQVQQAFPEARFVIPVAPTLDLPTLARFADRSQNRAGEHFGDVAAELVCSDPPYLQTPRGLQIQLWTQTPAYDLLAQCTLCLTTIGANTAELGALAVPMLVLMPTQQLDAMRAWDGLPGLLANLPGVGSAFAKVINGWFLQAKQNRLLAWPNIWAGKLIVPELIGELQPQQVAALVIDWLEHPEKLAEMRQNLRQVRGAPGAAQKLAQLALSLVAQTAETS